MEIIPLVLVLIVLACLALFVREWREKRRHHFTVGDAAEVPVGAHFYVLGAEDVWYRKRGPQAFDRVWGNIHHFYTLQYKPTTARPAGPVRWTRSTLLAKHLMLEHPYDLAALSEKDEYIGSLVMIITGLLFLVTSWQLFR